MADGPSRDAMATIDELLAQREQFAAWIAKIDEAGAAPDAVRARVREDYHQRLEETTASLREHGGAIAEELADLRGREADLTEQARGLEEALAEAQLRHAVGEYDEEKWKELSGSHDADLEAARDELGRVTGEISRLVEVQALISQAPAVAEAAPPEASEPADAPAAEAPPVGGAPRFEPRPATKGGEAPPRTLTVEDGAAAPAVPTAPADDELAFLKSVTEGPRGDARPAAAGKSAPAPAAKGAGPATAARTLKCAECGTMNRPTEWYCEKCGAELAAL